MIKLSKIFLIVNMKVEICMVNEKGKESSRDTV